MSNINDPKAPAAEAPDPQQIAPKPGELDEATLDQVGGGTGGGTSSLGRVGPVGPPPVGP